MSKKIKNLIWGGLVGGLTVPLFRYSFLDWQWWVYILIVIIAGFWAFI